MLAPKYKSILLVSILVLAIGVPVVIYASTVHGVENQRPIAKINAPDSGYAGVPITLSATDSRDPDGYISLYIWNFGDGTSSAGKVVNHTYMKNGTFKISLTVYDNAGGKDTVSRSITIENHTEKPSVVNVNELFSKTSDYIGRRVIVRGVFAYGHNYSFYMVNQSGYKGIRVYVEKGGNIIGDIGYNSIVEVSGRFTAYRNELEIKVENTTGDYVKLISHGGTVAYKLVNAGNWAEYNNSLIEITSKVTDVIASYKYTMLNFTVYVSYGANYMGTPAIGDIFKVRGFLTYYYSSHYNYGYTELYVRNGTDDYSKYISSAYSNATMSEVLENLTKYNNTAVHVAEAYVSSAYASWNFNVSSSMSSNNSLKIYVEKGGMVSGMPYKGAEVEIWGVITQYRGGWELKIRNSTPDKVVVKSMPVYENVSLDVLLNHTSLYNGSNVHTWGIITWTYHNATSGLKLFGLFYNGSEITVVGFNDSNISGVVSGYYADVYGEFTYYKGEWELKVRPQSYDHVSTKPQSYEMVNITDIITAPERYNNTLVHVPYSKIVNVYQSWKFWVSNDSGSKDIQVYVEKGGIVNGTPTVGLDAEIWGMVTEYNGTWELKIRNSTDDRVNVKGSAEYTNVSIDELLNNTGKYNNTPVYVPSAVVTYVYNASWLFYVSNNSNNSDDISVYIEKGANMNASLYKGAKVRIWAIVTQYNGKWELKVRNNTDDKVENVETVNYVNVTIEELLSNESKYNGTDLHIPNATVRSVYASYLFTVSNSTSNSNYISVYVQMGAVAPNVGVGDIIEIYGNVSLRNGSYELVIRSGTPDKVVMIHSSAKYVNFSYIHEVDSNGNLTHKGEQVIVNGTVIAPPSVFSRTSSSGKPLLKMYIEGSDGGVQVFGYNVDYTKLSLVEGDIVQVRGTLDQYNGETELKVSSLEYIQKLNHSVPITPQNLTTGYFKNWSAVEKIEGTLVYVNGTVTKVNTTNHYFYVDDGSGAVEIYVVASGVNMTNISVGDNVSVVGVVAQYDKTAPYTSYYEIMPRYQKDIVKHTTKLHVVKKADNINHNLQVFQNIEVITAWKRRNIALTVEDTLAH